MNYISFFAEKWFGFSNAKDIKILYFIFALLAGLISIFSFGLIRLELSGLDIQFVVGNILYNSIIIANAIVMIFFMVKFKC